ncbi:hypothetical protein SDC9_120349 [bioreactor metagenome]|uniref:Uncharacterized protein n=1 Tax=bioreactor metagenome TaxID=1076179 RepID=A0A645C6U2_9ZZZZ
MEYNGAHHVGIAAHGIVGKLPLGGGGRPAGAHGGVGAHQAGGGLVLQTGGHADGTEDVRIGSAHDHRHGAARRNARGKHLAAVHRIAGFYRVNHTRNQGRFPGPPGLVRGFKPVPALGGVGAGGLLGVEHQEGFLLCQDVHLRSVGEIARILRSAVEHDKQRYRCTGGIARGDIELIVPPAVGQAEKLTARRGGRDHGKGRKGQG